MWRRISFLVSLLVLQIPKYAMAQGVPAAEDRPLVTAPNCNRSGGHYEPLACWLYQLQIVIPDQTFHAGFFSISMLGMKCTGLTIADITSGTTQSNAATLLQAGIPYAEASCVGKYKSQFFGGNVDASVSSTDKTALGLELSLNSTEWNGWKMASAVHTVGCSAHLNVVHLTFSGSVSAEIIDLFSGLISSHINSALRSQLCPLIKSNVDTLLTQYLQDANKYLEPFLPVKNEANSLSSRMLTSVSQMTDFTILDEVLSWLSAFVDGHLRGCGGGLMHFLFPHDFVSIPVSIPYSFSAMGRMLKVHVNRVDVQGMAGITNLTFGVEDMSDTSHDADKHRSTYMNVPTGLNITTRLHLSVRDLQNISQPLEENFDISVNMTRLELGSNVHVSFRDSTHLGTVAHHLLCALEALSLSNISLYTVLKKISIDPLDQGNSSKVFGAVLERDVDHLINSCLEVFLSEYPELITQVLLGMTTDPTGPVQSFLDKTLTDLVQDEGKVCGKHHVPSPGYVNFSAWNPLFLMNEWLQDDSTVDRINGYFEDCLVPSVMDTANEDLDWLTNSSSVEKVEVQHMGSVQQLGLFYPNGTNLKNSILWGADTRVKNQPSITFKGIQFGSGSLNATLEQAIAAFGSVFFQVNVGMPQYDRQALGNITVGHILSRPWCALLPAKSIESTVQLDFGDIHVNITAALNGDVVEVIWNNHMNDDFGNEVNSLIVWATQSLQEVLNRAAIELVTYSKEMCLYGHHDYRNHSNENRLSPGNAVTSTVLVISFAALFLAQFIFIWKMRRGRESRDGLMQNESTLSTPLLSPSAAEREDATQPATNKATNADSDDGMQPDVEEDYGMASFGQHSVPPFVPLESDEMEYTSLRGDDYESSDEDKVSIFPSLMRSTAIPEIVRHIFPSFLIGTIVLLVASNLSTGASVDLSLTIGGSKTIQLPSLFEFSLGNTIQEMFQARIFVLFFLVLVFSGIWPYAKLLLMIYAWMVAPRNMERRGNLLMMLDALGKFSLVDAYVLVLMLVAFRYHLELSGNTVLDVFVNPVFGFYGFLGATCASMIAGHVMVFYHRRLELSLGSTGLFRRTEDDIHRKESVLDHRYGLSQRPLSQNFQIGLVACVLLTIAFLMVGMSVKSFSFTFDGLAGLALGAKARKSYSLLSLGLHLPESVANPGFGIFILQVVYFFYAAVMPLACLCLILLLFMNPMPLSVQRTMVALMEIANAWSAVEVFCLSIIAALFEISTFASFIIGDRCDMLEQVIPQHTACFIVDAAVKSDVGFLVTGVLLNSMIVSVALRLARCATDERLAREAAPQSSDDGKDVLEHHPAWLEWVSKWKLDQWVFDDDIVLGPAVGSIAAAASNEGSHDEDEFLFHE